MAQLSSTAYIPRLAVFSVIPTILVSVWNNYTSARFQTHLGWAILIFFILVTASIHFSLTKIAHEEPKKFVFRYMTLSGLKLFGFLIIILIYALIKRQEALGFTLLFLTMYFFFSAFEVISFLKYFKK